jgi:hypothetical protein
MQLVVFQVATCVNQETISPAWVQVAKATVELADPEHFLLRMVRISA